MRRKAKAVPAKGRDGQPAPLSPPAPKGGAEEAEDGGGERRRARTDASAGDDIGAAELAGRVAESLRTFRRDRHLSLDDLSAKSGVSRAALSQIEGARTNPTLAVLWKIAVGLGIPFNDLLGAPQDSAVLVLRARDMTPLRSADGRMESRLLSPGRSSSPDEVYELRFLPKAMHKSDPHARGTAETLVVLTGSLRLGVGTAIHELMPGDAAFFHADVEHYYENRSPRETRCIDVIHYPKI